MARVGRRPVIGEQEERSGVGFQVPGTECRGSCGEWQVASDRPRDTRPSIRVSFRILSFGFRILIWDCLPLAQRLVIRSFLVGEELFQDGANCRHVHRGDLPDDLQIHVCIVMRHDVAHAAHFPKRGGLERPVA